MSADTSQPSPSDLESAYDPGESEEELDLHSDDDYEAWGEDDEVVVPGTHISFFWRSNIDLHCSRGTFHFEWVGSEHFLPDNLGSRSGFSWCHGGHQELLFTR